MSANNYIRIQTNAHKTWDVYKCGNAEAWDVLECDADTGSVLTEIASGTTMEGAIREANKYQDENEVEYGLSIHTD